MPIPCHCTLAQGPRWVKQTLKPWGRLEQCPAGFAGVSNACGCLAPCDPFPILVPSVMRESGDDSPPRTPRRACLPGWPRTPRASMYRMSQTYSYLRVVARVSLDARSSSRRTWASRMPKASRERASLSAPLPALILYKGDSMLAQASLSPGTPHSEPPGLPGRHASASSPDSGFAGNTPARTRVCGTPKTLDPSAPWFFFRGG